MDIKQRLIEKGLTPQQAGAKAVEVMQELIAEDSGCIDNITAGYLKKVNDMCKKNEKQANLANNDFTYIKNQMIEMYKELRETRYAVENLEAGERSKIVNDEKLVDALNLYRAMLSDTKQVFGDDKMTEAVIIQAIEAASYGMWRSIMGGNFDESEPRKAGRKLKEV